VWCWCCCLPAVCACSAAGLCTSDAGCGELLLLPSNVRTDGYTRFCRVCDEPVDMDALSRLHDELEAELRVLEAELRVLEGTKGGDGVEETKGGDGVEETKCGDQVEEADGGDGVEEAMGGDGVQDTDELGLVVGGSALPSTPTVPGVTNTHSAGGAAGFGHSGQSLAVAVPKSERWKRLLRGKRLALVFGISNYEDAVPGHALDNLPVAARDAADMAAALVSMGYELITGRTVSDATCKIMWAAVEELQGKLEDGCTVVVYFTGHGMSGFLLPADADTSTEQRAWWRVCPFCGRSASYCCWLDSMRTRWRSLACTPAAQVKPREDIARFVFSCGPASHALTLGFVCGVLTPERGMTCVSVHDLLSSLGDTLCAYSTAFVCLLLDCCREAASERGLPEGVVPEPPQGCVESCKKVSGLSRFGKLCACWEAL
jgi:hypothetical protein